MRQESIRGLLTNRDTGGINWTRLLSLAHEYPKTTIERRFFSGVCTILSLLFDQWGLGMIAGSHQGFFVRPTASTNERGKKELDWPGSK